MLRKLNLINDSCIESMNGNNKGEDLITTTVLATERISDYSSPQQITQQRMLKGQIDGELSSFESRII